MLDAIDGGSPVRAMRIDINICIPYVVGWPAMARSLKGEVIPRVARQPALHGHSPYGVVGRIFAFNHPMMFAATRPLPALIAGNAVVIKPAPQTSLSTLGLAELFAEAFPPGVVNIVSGGADAGDAIVTHPDVKRIAFTGSVGTGLKIQRARRAVRPRQAPVARARRQERDGRLPRRRRRRGGRGRGLRHELQRLPGPVVRVELARARAPQRSTTSSSPRRPSTCATTRVGVAYTEEADMGPLVSAQHYERVSGFVESGVKDGATLVTGGDRPDGTPAGGYFMKPALFADVQPSMAIGRRRSSAP